MLMIKFNIRVECDNQKLYTANVLLVNSTDCVGVTNPTVVQTYFQLILTTNLTMRKTVKATYFYCCIKELIMHIS